MRSRVFPFFRPGLITIMALAVSCCLSGAEELVVFTVSSKLHKISRYSVDSMMETDGELGILSYKAEKKVGHVQTGDTPFAGIVEKAIAERRVDGPFFGPGFKYIVKDAVGAHYLVYFEYEAGHKTFRGSRMGMGKANDLGSGGTIFVGHPYDGISFDKELLAQFKKIADQK